MAALVSAKTCTIKLSSQRQIAAFAWTRARMIEPVAKSIACDAADWIAAACVCTSCENVWIFRAIVLARLYEV